MAKPKIDIMKMDLYGILGVSSGASEKEIMKAYRKKALKCHPDKNPDPKAAELFHELSKALEVLTDPSAKAAYDNVLRARKQAEERNRALDSKRKKMKDDLEAREQNAERTQAMGNKAEQDLLAEVERLRKEGSRLLEEMQKEMKTKLYANVNDDSDSDQDESPKLKLRWNAKRADTVGDYTEEDIRALFSRYGHIANILVSSKKKGSAIIEFESVTPMLKLAENELGSSSNPLTVTWLSGKPSSSSLRPAARNQPSSVSTPTPNISTFAAPQEPTGLASTGTISHRDYESLVLMKMRQAEERKRLIEQIQREEEEEN